MAQRYDAIIVGGGHNGLVCAAYLAKAGKNVLVLERRRVLGGAAVGRVLATDSLGYLLVWLFPVLAIIAINLASRRPVPTVSLVSGALIVVAFFKVPLLAAPIWENVGRALVGPFV